MSVNSALLSQIQQGKKLKKTATNDRSAPILDGAAKPGGGKSTSSAPVLGGGGAPQLGGLFAGGMPKLRPAAQTQSSPALGKPPSIPKRSATTSVAPTPIVPPAPRARDAPARAVSARTPALAPSSAPATPRRPPPPARPASPPSARRPPPPARPVSPPRRPNSTGPPSTLSRQVPPPPPRPSSTQSPSLPARRAPAPPTASGRAPPPPPPPRPSSTIKTSTTPAAPPPPARTAIRPPPSRTVPQRDTEEATATRARSASTGGGGTAPIPAGLLASLAPPPHAPIGMRGESHGRRAVSVSNVNGIGSLNGTKKAGSGRIPSPPPSSGSHTFPSSSDFPPPRGFVRSTKKYASGNVRGCIFDVSALA